MKKNFFAKTVSTLLIMLMVLSTVAVLPMSAAAPTTYDVSIASADDLVNLGSSIAALTSKTTVNVQLTADVNMSGKAYTPVSTTKVIYFNGNGKTISNLSIGTAQVPVENAGLFKTAGAGSTFTDLTLASVSIYGTEFTGAVIANPVYGDLTLSKITVSGSVSDVTPNTSSTSHVGFAGGLIGGNDYFRHTDDGAPDYEATWKLAYCVNAANVTAPVSAAGLVGATCGAVNMDVDYCANTGTITAQGLGTKPLDNHVAGIANVRHHAYAADDLYTDGSFRNCFNTGKLVLNGKNSSANHAGTGGIVGVYATLGASPYQNTLEFYNCFDLSQRDFPDNVANDANPMNHGAIAIWTAESEIPMTTYTNCYGATAEGSPKSYGGLYGFRCGPTTLADAAVVESGDSIIMLGAASTTLSDMIQRLATAITNRAEVVMPSAGLGDDGKDRDYTWYYNAGNLVTDKGTEAAPYEISSAAQFAALSALTWGYQDSEAVGGSNEAVNFNGKYFKLTADIDMDGYQAGPLNMEDATVVFDGNGKKISNWAISGVAQGAMFSALGKNSAVKNLTLDNVDVNAIGTSAIVVATAKAGLTLTSIKITDTSSLVTAGTIGASLVGSILDDEAVADDIVKITYCVNEADVAAKEQVGGLVGKLKGVFNYQITYCANKGDVTATHSSGGTFYVGGIIACTERGTQTEGYYDTFIQSTYNVGKLTTQETPFYCYVGGIAGYLKAVAGSEITIKNCYDASARKLSTTCAEDRLKNGAIGGNADDSQLAKYVDYSYAANGEGSQALVTTIVSWPSNNSIVDGDSKVVANLDAEITNINGEASTMRAEMAKIDTAIAEGSQISWNEPVACEHAYDNDCDADCNKCGEKRTPAAHVYDNDQDTACNVCGATRTVATAAPETTTAAPAEEKTGCGSALNSTYAVIALVAVLGFAFVAKKKEEN